MKIKQKNKIKSSFFIRKASSFIAVLYIVSCLYLTMLAGCNMDVANDGINKNVDSLSKTRNTKELHVGYFLFEPTIIENAKTGKLTGVFVDLIEEIAKSLNAKVVYHKVDLAHFVAGLQSQQYDISIGATFATPQRATAVAFTSPIFYCGYTGVIQKESPLEIYKWQDIDKEDLTVAVKQGSAIDDFVRENFTKAKILRLTGGDLTLPLAAVSSMQADIGLMNQLTVFTYLREHSELIEILESKPIAPTYFSWAVRQNDTKWLQFLNTCIEYYLNTGEMYYWESKYGIPLMHIEKKLVFPKQSFPEYWKLRNNGGK
ncbi:MAG: ABC transporter substrate-binding protein [Candidatus Brocadiaceae bacterium]|nr:ABC transporter substrate-binding protein [Candidatus Brocadiaceae bacterium]